MLGIIIFSVMLAWWYFFPLVLLDHHQHTLLKGRGCGTAHAQMRCHPETKSKVRSRANVAAQPYMVRIPTWSRFPSLNFPCRGNCIKFPLSFLVLADSLAPDGAFLKHSYQDFHSTTALQVNYYSRQSTPESLSYRLIISGRLVIPSVVPLKSSPSRLFIAEYLVPPEHPWHFRWSPLGRDTINTGSGTRGPRFLRAVLHCNS